jgi:excisionase family DNA binding protein
VAEHRHQAESNEHPRTPPATGRRLALSKAEAAEALGVSVDFLERHVMPELRVVRRGRRRLIPIVALEQWLDHNAERAAR